MSEIEKLQKQLVSNIQNYLTDSIQPVLSKTDYIFVDVEVEAIDFDSKLVNFHLEVNDAGVLRRSRSEQRTFEFFDSCAASNGFAIEELECMLSELKIVDNSIK
ncbi:hypothetical protein [Photobacterium leiognathi]|uniref:hypothetical protein n=1 Tax=Photobacterium leiognathi TaxID=553611 RepID=UPI002980DEC2|nr:hypothetical protein [Photobacterium leiognathi]